jgi:glycosyltransferase involved in cell wall biosynthesis
MVTRMPNDHKFKHIIFLRNPEENPAWGGLEKLMFEWFERIDYNEYQVTLSVTKKWVGIFKEKLSEKNLPVQVVDLPFEPKKDLFLKRFFSLISFLNKKRPDTIVFMQGWMFSFNVTDVLAGALIAPGRVFLHENLGPPNPVPKESKQYFGFIEGLGLWWYLQIYKALLRAHMANKIIVVSREIKERLVSLWQYPEDQVLVKHHGVDLDQFKPSNEIRTKMREILKIPSDETVIVIASRLSKEKCIHRSIEAFGTLSRNTSNLTLLILGDGPLNKDLRTLAEARCGKKALFLGHVGNVGDYLKMSDIFLLSSDNEGFGISLIEAMATGLICVSTKCPGPNEIIQDGINGFLVEKSTDGVLEGLSRALKLSTVQKSQVQAKAVSYVTANFEINERVREVFEVLGIGYLK